MYILADFNKTKLITIICRYGDFCNLYLVVTKHCTLVAVDYIHSDTGDVTHTYTLTLARWRVCEPN